MDDTFIGPFYECSGGQIIFLINLNLSSVLELGSISLKILSEKFNKKWFNSYTNKGATGLRLCQFKLISQG